MPNLNHISAAFRSSRRDECYLFIKNELVVVNYAPGTEKEEILSGPVAIQDAFHHILAKTPFANGIDCAFDTDGNRAILFRENQCVKVDYAPHSIKARILSGPMTIASMFPFLKGTVFENGVDAAIKTVDKQVFIFKGDRYARIDYDSESLLTNKPISDAFASWVGTVFENGLDAAFASHIPDEAYIFKGDYFARINVAPGTVSGDFIVGGRIKRINSEWSSLTDVLQS